MLKVLWIFLLQNHGFGCNYNRFGKDGYLDAISRESNIRSEFVFCATNTQIWDGYSRVEDTKDMLLIFMFHLMTYGQQIYDRSGSMIDRSKDVSNNIVALVFFYGVFNLDSSKL